MNLRFTALLLGYSALTLASCSLFDPTPKVIPERYQAQTIYRPIHTPPASSYAASTPPAVSTAPVPKPPQTQWTGGENQFRTPNRPNKQPEKKPAADPAPEPKIDVASLPFAIAVPGDPNIVTLPEELGSNAEIDVTGIEPGTAVEIPDPNKPGSSIQFRVPLPASED